MNPAQEEVPLGIPPIRQWELHENSTRYDELVAAPSDEDLSNMWLAWVIISWAVAAFIATVLLAILRSWQARQNVFNVYLCFLMLSDFIFSFLCGLTCLFNRLEHHYFAPWMCRFQSFYCIWAIGSSIWMNAVIAWQIHTMLRSSHIRVRYQVPSRKLAIQHSMLVYLFCAVVAGLGILPYEANVPHRSYAVSGEACLPTEYNVPSTYFMFFGFFPLFAGIPLAHILWVSFDVWQKGLLPSVGRRRALFFYFARITLSLLVMWVPFLLMVFAAARPWVNFAGGTWSHLQGAVSAAFGLMKPDTKKAFLELWLKWSCCGGTTIDNGSKRASNVWKSRQMLDSWVSATKPFSSSPFSIRRSNSASTSRNNLGLEEPLDKDKSSGPDLLERGGPVMELMERAKTELEQNQSVQGSQENMRTTRAASKMVDSDASSVEMDSTNMDGISNMEAHCQDCTSAPAMMDLTADPAEEEES